MTVYNTLKTTFFTATVWILAAVLWTGQPSAHGPGGHGDNAFTALQSAEKGMELYNRLIVDGRIEESWETGLTTIGVSTRGSGAAMEYVVRFDREEGDPQSLYIFFDMEGKYTGSNFTGE
jgi:hypothetical protein